MPIKDARFGRETPTDLNERRPPAGQTPAGEPIRRNPFQAFFNVSMGELKASSFHSLLPALKGVCELAFLERAGDNLGSEFGRLTNRVRFAMVVTQ